MPIPAISTVGILLADNIKVAIRINIRTKGNNNKNHDKYGAPALQIKFRIQVQKIT